MNRFFDANINCNNMLLYDFLDWKVNKNARQLSLIFGILLFLNVKAHSK